jgi:hypothetical protein
MPQLPVIKSDNKDWFFDRRLRQLRNVDNPHEYIDLSEVECAVLSAQVGLDNFAL